jgi:hypothetical protein
MIEKQLRAYLAAWLTDVPVLMETPEVPSTDYPEFPSSLVLIQRISGRKTDKVSRASFAIQSYGASLLDAAELDEDVREAMEDFVWEENIGAVSLASCYNHTDPRDGKYRYQSTFDITHLE